MSAFARVLHTRTWGRHPRRLADSYGERRGKKKKKQLIEVTHRQMWLSASRVPLKAFGLACLKVLAVSIGNKAAVVHHT